MQPKTTKKKIDDIVSKYVDSQTKGSAVAIQDLVKRINGSGLKKV